MILFLKYKWFDMIANYEKMEEYRVQSPYNMKQFWRFCDMDTGDRMIEFRRGYTKTAITRRCTAALLWPQAGYGNCWNLREEWGFERGKKLIVYCLARS